MQVNCTDSTVCSNSTNFKAVRYCPGYLYNEAQKSAFEGLKTALSTPMSKNSKKTLVDLFEKNGSEFYVAPAKDDSVQLFLANSVEDRADFKMQDFNYFHNVGEYSTKTPITFKKIEDLMDFAKREDNTRKSWLRFAGAFFLTTISCIIGSVTTAFLVNNRDTVNTNAIKTEVVTDNTAQEPPVVIEIDSIVKK